MAKEPDAKAFTLSGPFDNSGNVGHNKRLVIAVSESDMLDAELMEALKKELPQEVESVFISSVTQQGLTQLKDLIWKNLH